MLKGIILFFFTIVNFFTFAQPVLIRSISNSILELEYQNYSTKNKQNDTLELPFFDDFSKKGVYPDQSLWLDNFVYINQSFGKNPKSIGVATFDILNMAGQIYSNASETPFIADYLTSKPINLKFYTTYNTFSYPTNELFYYESSSNHYYPSDSLYYYSGSHLYNCYYQPGTFTSTMHIYYGSQLIDVSDSLYYYDSQTLQFVHIQRYYITNYNPSDSIYLSFYYQAQGNGGNSPENFDSLVLEFKTPDSDWTHVWSVPGGNSDTTFHKVIIPLDSNFLKNGFQFRFYNYASFGNLNYPSFASNVDFWNLDYVYLNSNRHFNDSIYPDVCFIETIRSLIKPPYTSVPWEHYKLLDSLQIDTLRFNYYNLYSSLLNIKRFITINNITLQQFISYDSLGNENINPFEKFYFKQKTKPNLFPDNNLTKSTFEVLISVTAPTLNSKSIFMWNDTLRLYQIFNDYYAIDDGSAEYGIGLSGVNSQNGQLAMLFKTLTPDTLRAIDMFFNRTLNNAGQKYFYITIWNTDANGKPGQIIYKKAGFRPEYSGINEFHRYNLDTAIYIEGNVFIGWTQTSTELLNLGFDLNYDYSNNVYYNLTGSWNKLPYQGTPMIRPVFSKSPLIHVNNNQFSQNFIPYPNPVSNLLTIAPDENVLYTLFDISGKIITEGYSNIIETSKLDNGIYFLKINQKNKINNVYKIMVQHP